MYWRKASDPAVQSRDRKGSGDGGLRLFNADAGSFNKLLPIDMTVSPGPVRQDGKKTRGAQIVLEGWPGRTFGIWPILSGMRCPGSGFRALHSPPGPHSPIGRGSGLKIRPVSVRVRLGAPAFAPVRSLNATGARRPNPPCAASSNVYEVGHPDRPTSRSTGS